jgi:hypothetical protein
MSNYGCLKRQIHQIIIKEKYSYLFGWRQKMFDKEILRGTGKEKTTGTVQQISQNLCNVDNRKDKK